MPKIGLSKNIDNPKIIFITLTTELPSEKDVRSNDKSSFTTFTNRISEGKIKITAKNKKAKIIVLKLKFVMKKYADIIARARIAAKL